MIKVFEEYISKYKVGDYIEFIDKDKIHNNVIDEKSITSKGKITKVDWLDVIYYQVMRDDKSYTTISQNENLITRYLTDDEIEDFKIRLQAKKYNL